MLWINLREKKLMNLDEVVYREKDLCKKKKFTIRTLHILGVVSGREIMSYKEWVVRQRKLEGRLTSLSYLPSK